MRKYVSNPNPNRPPNPKPNPTPKPPADTSRGRATLQARLAPTAERLARAEDPYIRYALRALTDVVVETLGQLFADVSPTPRPCT